MFYFLVTTRKGAEKAACLEALDIAHLIGVSGKCRSTRFEGVLLLELESGLSRFYETALRVPISPARRLVPLVDEVTFLSRWSLFEGVIRPKCVDRGRADCESILDKLAKLNPRSVYTYLSDARNVLHVEAIDEFVGFFILPRGCDAYLRVVFSQRLGRRCLEAISQEEELLRVAEIKRESAR